MKTSTAELELAERIRKTLLEAGAAAYEDARISGLCGEGAWEIAYGAIRDADLSALAQTAAATAH
ncbi:MAG TPA: hypothetical protein VFQ88_04865 [Nevskiaceae bacterium]|nr:hypothetical protein [Nevskiaceae bacterium]